MAILLLKRTLAGLLFGFATASGALDAWRLLRPHLNQSVLYTQEELYLADWVRENTSPNSIWLTSDKHNHWLYNLTGRQALMAYNGWLWTHGYEFGQVNNDVHEMFLNPGNRALFDRYRVTHVVLGPSEINEWKADPKKFGELFSLIHKTDHYSLYSTFPPESRPSAAPPAQSNKIYFFPAADLKLPVKEGLVKTVYVGKYFFGKPRSIGRGADDLFFWYDAPVERPFPTPCSIEWKGYLKAPQTGRYAFSVESDDGARLYLDETEVIDNWGEHEVKAVTREADLSAGFHKIKIHYFDAGGGAILRVKWRKPGRDWEDLKKENLSHEF